VKSIRYLYLAYLFVTLGVISLSVTMYHNLRQVSVVMAAALVPWIIVEAISVLRKRTCQ